MYENGPQATTGHLDLLDALPIMILDVDRDGVLQFANKRVRERLGLPAVLEDLSLSDILDASSQAHATTQLSELFSGDGDITSTWKLRTRTDGVIQVDANLVTIYENGYPVRVRTYLHDGSALPIPAAAAPMPTAAPVVVGSVDAKAALKEEQEYTKALINKSGLLVYILDTQNHVVQINEKMERVTGFNRESAPHLENLLAGLYPDPKYRGIVQRIHENMSKNQHIRETELSVNTNTGEVKHISWSTARLKNARNLVHGFIAMGIDVSEKKRLEQWLKLQTSCFERVSDAVVVSDLNNKIINWMGGAERMLGFASASMVGQPLSTLFPEEQRGEIETSLSASVERENKWVGEFVMVTADGRRLFVRQESAVILNEKGSPIALVSVIRDQTREKQYERELHEEREETAQLNRLLEDREQSLQSAAQHIEDLERQSQHIEDLERRLEYLATKNRDLEQDLSRRSGGQAALEETMQELSIFQTQLLATSSVAIITLDPGGNITTWSRGAEELLRKSDKEAFGRPHDQVLIFEECDWELLRAEAEANGRVQMACTARFSDGEKATVELECLALKDESGAVLSYAEIIRPPAATAPTGPDLTPQVLEASEQGLKGELAANLADTLDDVFSAQHSNLRRLQDYVTDLKRVVELYRTGVSHRDIEAYVRRIDLKRVLNDLDFLFEESGDGLMRMRNLAQDVHSILQPEPSSAEVLNINEVADSVASLVRQMAHHRARIDRSYSEPSLTRTHRGSLVDATVAIVRGCIQSFKDATAATNEVKLATSLDGSQVLLEIRTNGPSPSDAQRAALSDPKELVALGGAANLSFALALQLLGRIGAGLQVLETDDGPCFRISLASWTESASDLYQGADRPAQDGSVLFVDDDKNMLRSYRRYFEPHHQIFQADTAPEALRVLSVRQDFRAVVLDVLLPEPEGLDLIQQLLAQYPKLANRVVLLLPPTLSPGARESLKATGCPMLSKPVQFDSLASILALLGR